MNRAWAALAALTPCACTLLVSTSDLAGSPAASDASTDASTDTRTGIDGATSPLGASCRAIRDRLGDAGSGSYMLATDGGVAVQAHCDMESFGGGWTLVTPAMIVDDKAAQDYAPGTPARVDVTRGTDARGGIVYSLNVAALNCGANSQQPGPGHYFRVGELDGWTQIMATYEFSKGASCWEIFGDSKLRNTNVLPFDPALDLIGPQENMSRTSTGVAIPFDGRTTACDQKPSNFWSDVYKNQQKSARVVLRRLAQGMPAGLALSVDCGLPAWSISDIRVR